MRFADGPGTPYKGIIDGLWPQLGDEDPRQYAWDIAYREATTGTIAYRPSRESPLEFPPPGRPDPLRDASVRALVRVTCAVDLHNRSRPPTLAEVWHTSPGLLFIAKLPGRHLNPGEVPGDPFEPPAAVRNWRSPAHKKPAGRTPTGDWDHVPITMVRLLLADDVAAPLWVKCVDHGPAQVDRVKLFRAYEVHVASGRADTPEPRIVRLDSVGTLSSD